MANLITELAELWPRAQITLLVTEKPDDASGWYAEALLSRDIEVVFTGRDTGEWLERRRFHYSVVIVSRPHTYESFDDVIRLTQPQAMRVFDVDALGDLESRAIRTAQAIFCASEEHRRLTTALAPELPVFVLPSFVEIAEAPLFERRRDLVFFGSFTAGPGSPNEDAVLHLVSDVLPAVWKHAADIVLHVVGSDPTHAVRALHGPRVNVVGFVPEPAEWLTRARLHVCPLRAGAGIQLKLLDTMAAGLPFVTTEVGAEGIPLGGMSDTIVGEDASGLAELVLRLYTNRNLWEDVQRHLLHIARTRFDHASFSRTLITAMSHLGIAPPSGSQNLGRSVISRG